MKVNAFIVFPGGCFPFWLFAVKPPGTERVVVPLKSALLLLGFGSVYACSF